jgi:pyrroloquinoline quinone biosynthesis protein D
MSLAASSRPALARRARVRWDEARATHVMLYPEGVIVLTAEAAEVLALCDGARTLGDITSELAARYPDADAETVATDVRDLLERLAARGFIREGGAP